MESHHFIAIVCTQDVISWLVLRVSTVDFAGGGGAVLLLHGVSVR